MLVAAFAAVVPNSARKPKRGSWSRPTSGRVLQADNATMPWYPASVTKIMTAYVTLKAVKEGRLTLEQTLTVSPVAASQAPSKMGFKPGTQVTVENALAMMMVKSANDMAVVLAEGVGGSIDGFSAMMNQAAQRLGMTQTSYVNPNGLPADGQITSARDLAILARAVIRELPEYEYFMHIPAIRFGRRVTNNFNKLIGRYPGADGFKTGFICASGYNLVASATRNDRRLIAVVLGSSSGRRARCARRNCWSAALAAAGCRGSRPSKGTVESLAPIDATPPNLRDEMCNGKRKRPATDEDDGSMTMASASASGGETGGMTFFTAGLQAPMPKASEVLLQDVPVGEPMVVYTGPKKSGAGADRRSGDGFGKADHAARQALARGGKKPDGAAEPKPPKPAAASRPSRRKAEGAARRGQAGWRRQACGKACSRPSAAQAGATAKPKPEAKPAS